MKRWSTSSWSKRNKVGACSSTPGRPSFCCRASARSSSPSNGPGSTQPSRGSASPRRSYWVPVQTIRRHRIRKKRRSAEVMACIEARGLRKSFGPTIALDGIDLRVEEGHILGLIGPNGAGKSTALNAILGLTPFQGELRVLGRDPWTERDRLMRDVSFIADVAVLPRWIRVSQVLDYVSGVHPRFDRAKAEGFLARTTIRRGSKVRELSKVMVAQLHLPVSMPIDPALLVLTDPP